MKLKKGLFVIILFVILFVIGGLFLFYNSKNETFSVKTFLLKTTIPVGGESIYKINIKNNEDSSKEFIISLENIDELASTEDTNFLLEPNEEKEVSILIKDFKSEVAVYSGKLIVSDGLTSKQIPIVVTIEDNRNLLSIIHSTIPAYSNVYPGGKFGVDIKVYNLDGFNAPTLKANSFIQDFNGNILWTDEQNLIVDGSKIEIVEIPKNWPKGNYIFFTIIDYKGIKSVSTYLFNLSSEEYNILGNFNAKLFIFLILIFILGFVILLFYFIKSRDEFLIALKKQQHEELCKNVKLINISKREIEKSKKPLEKKKQKIKKLKRLKKKIIKKIKKKQKAQLRELKKMRKQKKKNKINEALKSWKSKGYKMFEAEEELGKDSNFKKQLGKWKNQGYKI